VVRNDGDECALDANIVILDSDLGFRSCSNFFYSLNNDRFTARHRDTAGGAVRQCMFMTLCLKHGAQSDTSAYIQRYFPAAAQNAGTAGDDTYPVR
jgi:hypothetical protein